MKIHEVIGKEWPGGISDGLTLRCKICNKIPCFDYTVTDDSWRLIVPPKHRLDVICLKCFDVLANRAGIKVGDVLSVVQFTGHKETVLLHPYKSYRY